MSLNFDLSKIANYETTCYETIEDTPERLETLVRSISFFGPSWGYDGDDRTRCIRMRAVTHVLVWGTMSVMMGSITEKNWRVFYTRFAMMETVLGAFLVVAAFRPAWQPAALVAGFVSVVSFLWLAWATGGYNAQLARVFTADLVALGCLVVAAVAYATQRGS